MYVRSTEIRINKTVLGNINIYFLLLFTIQFRLFIYSLTVFTWTHSRTLFTLYWFITSRLGTNMAHT